MPRKLSTASLLYLPLAFASFYPQSLRPRDTVAYVGDSLESVYIVAWNVHQFFRAPQNLFDANVLHPHLRALTFTDHRLLPSLAVAPVVWATGNPVLACNVAVAFMCLLAAWAARRLALALGASPVAAWAAGALYGFHTYQINETPRLNIVSHAFIPLALVQLVLFLKGGGRRPAWALAGLLLLQGLSSNYHLLYAVLLVAIVTAGALVARPAVVARRLPGLILPGLVAALAFAPLAIPYLRAARAQGFQRELPAGIDLRHYVSTPASNLFYGHIGADVRLQQRGPHFVGFVSLALAAAALLAWAGRRGPADPEGALLPARVWVPAAAALALLFVALSLGRDAVAFGQRIGPGPYRLLWELAPGFKLVRIPERLGLLAMLFVALLAARGLDLVRHAGFRSLALLVALLVPLEHLASMPGERVPVTRNLPEVYRWLQENPAAALGEAPVRSEGLVRQETLEMYFSTVHFKRTLHGYTAYPPLLTVLLRRILAEFPSDLSLQALTRVGVDTVIVHRGRPYATDLARQVADTVADASERPERFRRLARLARLDLFERLPPAVAAGRVQLLASFAGPPARLFASDADEVYRLFPLRAFAPAPFPAGERRAPQPGWRYRAKSGDARLAFDGTLATAWSVARPLLGDELLEVTFDQPLRVSGLRLPLRRDSAFPTRFRIAALTPERRWMEVARYDEAHALQLLERLLADARTAALGFELGGRECLGLSLLVEEGGTSFEGWSVPEFEVLTSGSG